MRKRKKRKKFILRDFWVSNTISLLTPNYHLFPFEFAGWDFDEIELLPRSYFAFYVERL